MTREETEPTIKRILAGYPDVQQTLKVSPEAVDRILAEHIEHHKWLINEKIPSYPVSLEQAFFSWYENVFQPQLQAMRTTGVFRKFPKSLPIRLFDEISQIHYHTVNEDHKYVAYEAACYTYIYEHSRSWITRIIANLRRKFY